MLQLNKNACFWTVEVEDQQWEKTSEHRENLQTTIIINCVEFKKIYIIFLTKRTQWCITKPGPQAYSLCCTWLFIRPQPLPRGQHIKSRDVPHYLSPSLLLVQWHHVSHSFPTWRTTIRQHDSHRCRLTSVSKLLLLIAVFPSCR